METWKMARKQYGFDDGDDSNGNATQKAKNKSWEDAMQAASAAALAAKADPQTMLGYAVGKMLSRYLFNNKGDNGSYVPTAEEQSAYVNAQGGNQSTNVTTPDTQMVEPRKGLLEMSQMKEPYTGDWAGQVDVKKDFFSPKEIKDPMSGLGIDISKYIKM